jgi:hypothetical protein
MNQPADGAPIVDPPWQPWSPSEVAQLLGTVRAPWCVAAGWAVELFLQFSGGEPSRPHEDIEIAVRRAGFPEVRAVRRAQPCGCGQLADVGA